MSTVDPLSEYFARLELWCKERARGERISVQLGNSRLGLVVASGGMAWLALGRNWLSGWTLLVPLAVFIVLLIVHERIARRLQLANRAIAYFENGLARLDDRWAGTGNGGERFADAGHLYSGDLDLFGRGSLFELVSVARTAEGEQRLANWLLAPAGREECLSRQSAIAELRDHSRFREDVALLGDDVRAGVHSEALARWATAPAVRFPPGARFAALALALWNIAAFALFMAQLLPGRAVLVSITVALGAGVLLRRPTQAVTDAADTAPGDLEILSLLLERLEQETFTAPRLKQLRAALDVAGRPASARIHRLRRWQELLDSYDHVLVRVIGPPLLWRQQVAMAIEQWRRDNGESVVRWLDAVAELEALSSLAALAFERPTWTTPELAEGEPCFEAEEIRHPLMSPQRCVANDVSVGGETRLVLVSGSNMSGKSTLLRSVGLNTVLAWAGAPVAARKLRVTPVFVGASMRVVDSLQDNKSRFYAEITRLRQIADLASRERRVLFLLDELLSGTNSHDRLIGAEGVVKSLVESGAIGFVTTHDLALTRIPGKNVHFEDEILDGRISFDYKMRPGVVERSNALELMRAVGLDV